MNNINLIVARSSNNVIGNDNKLLWNFKLDMQHFIELTRNNSVIMGRKTYESIGKPLKNRKNIVLTNSKQIKDVVCVNNIEDAIKEANVGEIFIIGGSNVYEQFLNKNLINKIYITEIHDEYEGDSYFTFNEANFEKIKMTSVEENKTCYDFVEWKRK